MCSNNKKDFNLDLFFSFRKLILGCLLCAGFSGVYATGFCKDRSYNTSSSICCGGELLDLYQNGVKMGCCEVDGEYHIYKVETELCCGFQIGLNKTYTRNGKTHEKQCCGKKIMYPDEGKVCCDGVVVQMDKDAEACCGQEKHDRDTQICCENRNSKYQIYSKGGYDNPDCCGSKLYNLDHFHCMDKDMETIASSDNKTCGDTTYNTDTHLCCYEGTVMEKPKANLPPYSVPPIYDCREGIIYDTMRDQFIPTNKQYGIVGHTIPKGYRPCGNGYFNPAVTEYQQFCCDQRLRNASNGLSLDCCGTELYDFKTEACCGGKIISGHKKCCGNKEYDIRTSQQCCGNLLYRESESVCCERRTLIKAEYRNHTDCCWLANGDYKSFNRNDDKKCYRGKIVDAAAVPDPPVSQPTKMKEIPQLGELRNNLRVCPFCGEQEMEQIRKTRDRKREYRVTLVDITPKQSYTKLTVQFLGHICPHNKRMTITIKYRCSCLQKGDRYTIITNRNLRKKSRARLSDKDMIMLNTTQNKKLRKMVRRVSRAVTKVRGRSSL